MLTIQAALAAGGRESSGPVGAGVVEGELEKELAGAGMLSVAGQFEVGGQYHFHLETQTCLVRPEEDGLEILCATQHQVEMFHIKQLFPLSIEICRKKETFKKAIFCETNSVIGCGSTGGGVHARAAEPPAQHAGAKTWRGLRRKNQWGEPAGRRRRRGRS